MYAERIEEIDGSHYRAGYNPQFLARVSERRKAAKIVAKAAALSAFNKERIAALLSREAIQKANLERTKAEIAEITGVKDRTRFTYEEIERRACRLFNCQKADIRGQRRNTEIVFARQFVMYWATRLTALSMPLIGRFMNKDHTTIMHGKDIYVTKRAKMGRTLREAR